MIRFCTEYNVGGLIYCDYVDAPDWEAAQTLCDERRAHCSEQVVGELVGSMAVDEATMIRMQASLN